MSAPRLEDVFKTSGIPTYTFVEPNEYTKLVVALRTPGRGVVVEGPSGIGKTSAVETALRTLGLGSVTKLSSRKKADVEYIEALPQMTGLGLVIVDDFHRLSDKVKQELADFLKTLADEESQETKIVIVGINRAGERLIGFAADLVNRIDVIQFENNSQERVRELVTKGETALNVHINVLEEIVAAAQGSFYVAQLLALEVCLKAGILQRQEVSSRTELSFEGVRASVWDRLRMTFYEACRRFCQGSKMNRAGRAPYLHILKALAEGDDWSLSLRDLRKFDALRASVGQVVEKGFLGELIRSDSEISRILHYDASGRILTVEDPQLVFFIKHIPWAAFAKEIGFLEVRFEKRYDFALSFSGSDRDVAEAMSEALESADIAVFYDKNEQHRILASDVEEYLRPIYQSEASFVVCLLGPDYPNRIWTKIESDAFKQRFNDGTVIPVWFSNAPLGMFDESRKVGGLTFNRDASISDQVSAIVDTLADKLEEHRLDQT